jgi:hypothetical protein
MGDDTEYSARILRHELGILAPRSVVLHKTKLKHTAMDASPERYRLYLRNSLWMLFRSAAWSMREKLRDLLTIVRFTYTFLSKHRLSFGAVRAVALGFMQGFLLAPRANEALGIETSALMHPDESTAH